MHPSCSPIAANPRALVTFTLPYITQATMRVLRSKTPADGSPQQTAQLASRVTIAWLYLEAMPLLARARLGKIACHKQIPVSCSCPWPRVHRGRKESLKSPEDLRQRQCKVSKVTQTKNTRGGVCYSPNSLHRDKGRSLDASGSTTLRYLEPARAPRGAPSTEGRRERGFHPSEWPA